MIELEYELTFLAKQIPEQITKVKPVEVLDYYLPENGAKHPHLRLRCKGNKYELTKKQPLVGTDSSEQTEHTILLTKNEYNDLIKNRVRLVIKDRYSTLYKGYSLDVDVFKGKLQGLVLIDFEFKNKQDKNSFIAPDFCLADVTQEAFIAGGLLAGKSYDDIQKQLSIYGYKKLKY